MLFHDTFVLRNNFYAKKGYHIFVFEPQVRGGVYDMTVFSICQFFGRWYGDLSKKWTVFSIVTQRWRGNIISDRRYYGDSICTKIWLQHYGNFRKNQRQYGNLNSRTSPLYTMQLQKKLMSNYIRWSDSSEKNLEIC